MGSVVGFKVGVIVGSRRMDILSINTKVKLGNMNILKDGLDVGIRVGRIDGTIVGILVGVIVGTINKRIKKKQK